MTTQQLPAQAVPAQHRQSLVYANGLWAVQCPQCRAYSTYLQSDDNWSTVKCADCGNADRYAAWEAAQAADQRAMKAIYGGPAPESKPITPAKPPLVNRPVVSPKAPPRRSPIDRRGTY